MLDASKYEHLLLGYPAPGVLLVTINRPEKLNAVNLRLHRELGDIWLDVDRDDEIDCVVVTGAGDAFSAGGDFDWIASQIGDFDHVERTLRDASSIVYNMLRCQTPIISAINGAAVGAGLAVALVADISIIAEGALLRDGHLRLGLAAGDHAAMIWPQLCGMAKTKYYLLTCEALDGREAERIGLVSKAVVADRVLPEALRVATLIADGPTSATRWTKRVLSQAVLQSAPTFDSSLAFEMLGLFSRDVREGHAAVVGKRRPTFAKVKRRSNPDPSTAATSGH